jgi:hypothetical protein
MYLSKCSVDHQPLKVKTLVCYLSLSIQCSEYSSTYKRPYICGRKIGEKKSRKEKE